jgi:hypothetical protein
LPASSIAAVTSTASNRAAAVQARSRAGLDSASARQRSSVGAEMLRSRATDSSDALSGGNNRATALSLKACPYLATSFFHYRPRGFDSNEATTSLTQGDSKVTQAISEWKEKSAWAHREIHFSRFGRMDFDALKEYLGVIHQNREFLSFKVIAVQKSRTNRNIEEVIAKLHEHMLVRGAEHEIRQGRMDLPREIGVTIDEEQSLDPFALSEMARKVTADFARHYAGQLQLSGIDTVSSRNSALIQLADLIAGAVNRKLNHNGDRNYKDEMSDWIIRTLDLTLDEQGIPGLDVSALFRV